MAFKDFVWHKLLRRPYQLAVRDSGKGEVVVMLHGLAASGAAWQKLANLLGDSVRSIRPDLLGFGDSPMPDWSSYAVSDHARAVIYTLKKRGVQKPVTIVGHSMGCLIAAHIATKYPQWVKRLVLYAPPLFVDEPNFPTHGKLRGRYFAFYEYIVSHPKLALSPQRRLWRLARKTFGLYLDEQKWLPFERSLRNTIMAQQAYQDFVRLTVPTHIIHGRLDFVIVRLEVAAMLKANPNITIHAFTGTHNLTQRAATFIHGILKTT